jgi:orotidine-5'-phosphate decarboxylase
MTPVLALQSGASHLVIGRSVTRAAEPLQVLARINSELAALERKK